ncbi:hypothetical protein B0T17DRAFT_168633 [Bombardia bombarda]|uniref:Uncharacterized protein n=1 Tax=Bombardia bombarda TaxID=252184 RepID=A0AA39X8G1_9PEZI|nr:hypothetical protein B0T17DRAFT_168633 [Bombardia bombarda]
MIASPWFLFFLFLLLSFFFLFSFLENTYMVRSTYVHMDGRQSQIFESWALRIMKTRESRRCHFSPTSEELLACQQHHTPGVPFHLHSSSVSRWLSQRPREGAARAQVPTNTLYILNKYPTSLHTYVSGIVSIADRYGRWVVMLVRSPFPGLKMTGREVTMDWVGI